MAGQAGHDTGKDGPEQDAARRAALGRENIRLLVITFAGSLAAILAGTIILGLSVTFIRLFHKLDVVTQVYTAIVLCLVLLGMGVSVVLALMLGRLRDLWKEGPADTAKGNVLLLIASVVAALSGILFLVGLAAGVK